MTMPEERICVTRRAVLDFTPRARSTAVARVDAEREACARVEAAYPAPVRDWISLPRRIDLPAAAVARTRTRRDLSAVSMTVLQGGQSAVSARAPIFRKRLMRDAPPSL